MKPKTLFRLFWSYIVLFVFGLAAVPAGSGADVIINEFMARNSQGLPDETGAHPDWIELYNTSLATVNLEGWYLTDNTNLLTQWRFPATNLAVNGYLVIFASGKNHTNAGVPLHTSFQLNGDGEYLALVMPDGHTIASEFYPTFPPQYDDISFGNGQSVTVSKLVNSGAPARVLIPQDGTTGTNWTHFAFDDSGWSNGTTGVGFSSAGTTGFGLYSYWPIREGSGTTASNVVAGGTHGTLNGGAAWFNDPTRGTVLSFNGSSSYVSAGTIPRMGQSTSNFTWSFWCKQNAGNGVNVVVLGNRYGGVQSPLQFIKFTPTNFEYYRGANIGFIPYTIPNGQWLHLAVVKNGSSLAYFVNGAVVGTSTAGGDIEANPFYMGGDPGGEYASGYIDDVSLWTVALTTNQVNSLYQGTSPLALSGYASVVGTDVKASMLNSNATAYIRVAFTVGDTAVFDTLKLRMKYDDGFIAYLNGVEVARRNAPGAAQWNSTATAAHPDDAAVVFEEIDITQFLPFVENGPNLLAIHGLNLTASDGDFLILPELEAATITGLGARYFGRPTPGAVNDLGVIDYVADTKFNPDRGFYDTNFWVTITCKTPGATIRYTTNGAAPTETTGLVYTGPIWITNTTVLRAAAFKAGWQASAPDAQTYIFLDQVIRQTGVGMPTYSWGGPAADYVMDPRVVTNAEYASTIRQDMQSLPVVCISVNPNDFFGSQGIYVNTSWRGVTSERAASAEMFFPDGSRNGFQVNCGLRVAGGASRTMTPKHGLRLLFKSIYGPSKLNYRFFDNTDVDRFDTIQFRPNFNMSWVRTDNSGPLNNANADGAERTHAIYVRDQFTKESQLATGNPSAHERFVHLYINGLYWGVYNPSERTDASFAATYLGGDKEQYDAIFSELNTPTVPSAVDGDKVAWDAMFTLANAGLTNAAQYAEIQKFLDVTNLADYMMMNFFTCTVDWPWQNWNAARKRETNALFRFFVWDAEYAIETPPWVPEDRTTVGNEDREAVSPARLYRQLRQNPEWRLLFADRAQKFFFNNGALTTNQTIPRFLALCDTLDRAIVCESARWGDVVRTTQPYTRADWLVEKSRLLTQFFSNRTTLVIQQLKNAGLYPLLPAPSFNQYGGVFSNQFNLSISAPAGTIYYTTNGSDPRLAGGAIAPDAFTYEGGILLTESRRVRARAFYTNTWSAMNEADFINTNVPSLRITEIMYNPPPPDVGTNSPEDFEFIELQNIGSATLALAGYRFTNGITFTFPDLLLAPGEHIVVVRNRVLFESRYGTNVNIAGEYFGQLDDGGERLALVGAFGEPIHDFTYGGGWYPAADGLGFSLVVVDPAASLESWDRQLGWHPSGAFNGSPGSNDPPSFIPPIVVNEALTHTDPPALDAIELFNPTDTPTNIGGWFLTDNRHIPIKYRIPPDTIIPAGGYVVFDETQFNSTPGADACFSLNPLGEEVYLFSGDASTNLTGYSHGFSFSAAAVGASFGRYVNSVGQESFPAQVTNTLGSSNAGPRIGPVVITEIHYHAPNHGDEFVELQNITASTVPLYDPANVANTWKLAGMGFDFPTNIILAPNERLLVVATNPAVFRASHGIASDIQVLGPFSGALQHGGENLELERPDTPVLASGGVVVPYIVVDAVRYNDKEPWPMAADGHGASLQRLDPAAYANDPSNWVAAAPSPGQLYPGGEPPVITASPVSQSVFERGDATFTVGVSGTGPFFYQWLLNGANFAATSSGTLLISNVQLFQQGCYSVVVSGPAGYVVSDAACLTVIPIPKFVLQPQSTNLLAGGTVTFTVVATGTGPLAYQWRFNGVDILAATNSALTAANVQPTNSGLYTVLVTDSLASALSAPATLTVLVKPVIVQQPTPATWTGLAGSTASFTIKVTNTATLPLTYRWRRSTTPQTNIYITLNDYTCELVIPSVVSNLHSGSWTVIITNIAGGTTPAQSSPFALTVYQPPFMTVEPTNQYVNLGANVTLVGTAAGTAPLRYQWWFNETNLITGATTNSLTITNVQTTNLGDYTVVVTNAYGAVTSAVATLQVRSAPVVLVPPTNQTVLANSTVYFTVVVGGGGPYTYRWYFNGTTSAPGLTYDNVLELDFVQTSNAGPYHVVVTNAMGSVTSEVAVLTVLVPPSIVTPPSDQTVVLGSNVTFSVVATGTEPLSYQWLFNETNVLAGQTSPDLALVNVQKADAGGYSVTVRNAAGALTSAAARLTVLTPPEIVVQPTNQVVAPGSNVTLVVVAEGAEPLSYQWYFNTTNVVADATNSSLFIPNSSLQNAGDFVVVVSNALGVVTSEVAKLTVELPNLDSDGDGMLDWQEVVAGTDPHNAQSLLKVMLLDGGNGGALIQFTAMPSVGYTIQHRANLTSGSWLNLTNVAPQGGTNRVEITDPNAAANGTRYYRIVTPQQP